MTNDYCFVPPNCFVSPNNNVCYRVGEYQEGLILKKVKWTSEINEMIVPSSFKVKGKELPLIAIEPNAFASDKDSKKCSEVGKLILPDSVRKLMEGALSNIKSISSVWIPSSITAIPDYCCKKSSFKEITFENPNAITYVGPEAFSYTEISSFSWPVNVTAIPIKCFACCLSLTHLKGTEKVTCIEESAFYGAKIPSLEFFPNLEEIDHMSFHHSGLKSAHFPETCKIVGDNAFSNCEELEEVFLPDSVETVETGAFTGCRNLKKVRWSSSVKMVKCNVFGKDISLTDFCNAEGIVHVRSSAFEDTAIHNLSNFKSLKSLDEYAFSFCSIETLCMPQNTEGVQSNVFTYADIKVVKFSSDTHSINMNWFNKCQISAFDLSECEEVQINCNQNSVMPKLITGMDTVVGIKNF